MTSPCIDQLHVAWYADETAAITPRSLRDARIAVAVAAIPENINAHSWERAF
jgi:hypothetical protein